MKLRRGVWAISGRVAYWLGWPIIWLTVHGSKRTRVLVVCGNEVIVTKGWISNGKWTLPGGGVRKGEASHDAASRELYEETGLRLPPSQIRRHSEQVYAQGGFRFNYALFVSARKRKTRLQPQPVTLPDLHSAILDAQWVDRHELNAHNARADVLTALAARWKGR